MRRNTDPDVIRAVSNRLNTAAAVLKCSWTSDHQSWRTEGGIVDRPASERKRERESRSLDRFLPHFPTIPSEIDWYDRQVTCQWGSRRRLDEIIINSWPGWFPSTRTLPHAHPLAILFTRDQAGDRFKRRFTVFAWWSHLSAFWRGAAELATSLRQPHKSNLVGARLLAGWRRIVRDFGPR